MTRLAALLNQSPEFSQHPPAEHQPAPEQHADPMRIAAAPDGGPDQIPPRPAPPREPARDALTPGHGQELDQLAAVNACQQALSRMLARLG